MNLVLARIVCIIHLLAIGFIVFGWLLPQNFLIFHITFVPLTFLHWKTNNNRCVLTQLQKYFEKGKVKKAEEGDFVRSLFKKMGLELSNKQLFFVIYGLMFLSLFISILRYILEL
jgi:hypothetical protein